MTIPVLVKSGNRPYPPRLTAFTSTFWKELEAGRFLLSRCEDCSHRSFPPKKICPVCWSRKIGWVEHNGDGKLYSHTTVHAAPAYFQDELPFHVCIVDLKEGPRLATRLIRSKEDPSFNSDVRLVALKYDDGMLFAAQPKEAGVQS